MPTKGAMTLDLNTANLLAMTGGNGGATAQPAATSSGGPQTQGTGQPGGVAATSPFALLVNANQAQAQATTAPATPGTVRGGALTSASPLPLEIAGASPAGVPAANEPSDAVLAGEIVVPVTPVAAVSPTRSKPAMPVQDVIDPAIPTAAPVSAPAAASDKAISADKPVSEIILPEPVAANSAAPAQAATSPAGPAATPAPTMPGATAPAATIHATTGRAATGQATTGQATTGQPATGQTAAVQTQAISGEAPVLPAAPTTPSPVSPIADEAAPRSGPVPVATAVASQPAKPDAAKSGTAADSAHVDVKPTPFAKPPAAAAGLNAPAPGATGNPAVSAAPATPTTGASAPEQAAAAVNASENAPLRQRGSDAPAIQTASGLAARPTGGLSQAGNAGANGGQSGYSGTGSNGGNPATGTPSPTSSSADPAATLTAGKDALPTAAQSGAPITPPAGLQTGAQPQPVVNPDQAAADAAMQAETDFNLSRVDGRMAADRSATNTPRFTPHTTQQLAGQITKQVSNGNRVFDIRLDPAELGKVDVRIELRADNRVHAVLTVERPETLNELQRSARDLERSLAEAGLELDEDGLSFQMNDGETPTGDDGRGQGEALPIFAQTTELAQRAEDELASRPRSAYGFLLSGRSGVDVQV
ncbi:hypothetical protein AWH62_16200 [Maricaulis sp. W15]|nr:hypothetical protein AWH62_16200 [Maricaulis sp. W15]